MRSDSITQNKLQLITIKECHKSQLELLFEVAIQSYNDTYQYLWSDKGKAYLDEFYKKEDFKKELSSPDIAYYLIYHFETPVGYFKLKHNQLTPYASNECIEIDKLYLIKDHLGKGIGNTVMEFIVSLCLKKQRTILWLKTMESSAAKFFYEKYGFIQEEKIYLDYPTMKEEYRWILTMVLLIENYKRSEQIF